MKTDRSEFNANLAMATTIVAKPVARTAPRRPVVSKANRANGFWVASCIFAVADVAFIVASAARCNAFVVFCS